MNAPVDPGTTSTVLMIRPRSFGPNPTTRESNVFQRDASGVGARTIADLARREFDGLAQALTDAGVTVHAIDERPGTDSTDSVFPNNWVSLHADGTAVLYPMRVESRRAEVREDVIDELERRTGARWPRRVDLRPLVDDGAFLEGTGSLVLDRTHRVAYACRSERTTDEGCTAFADATGFDVHGFSASAEGRPVYHTNVLLALGPGFAVACLESIERREERDALHARLEATGREVIAIPGDELRGFCGNVLALRSQDGDALLAMSERARTRFSATNRARLEAHAAFVSADLTTIERYGGGSARCMLAEVFEPDA